MLDVQACLARFSSSTLVGAPDAREQARDAIDDLVAAHAASPLSAISALYALMDAFRDLKIVSRMSRAIDEDIIERILTIEQAMLDRATAARQRVDALEI